MIKYKILNEFEKVDKEFIDKNKGIEIIGTATTGLDHIDLKLCEKKNIKIVSLQDEREFLENITSTAEHTIGLIIALFRNYKTIFKNMVLDEIAILDKQNTLRRSLMNTKKTYTIKYSNEYY